MFCSHRHRQHKVGGQGSMPRYGFTGFQSWWEYLGRGSSASGNSAARDPQVAIRITLLPTATGDRANKDRTIVSVVGLTGRLWTNVLMARTVRLFENVVAVRVAGLQNYNHDVTEKSELRSLRDG